MVAPPGPTLPYRPEHNGVEDLEEEQEKLRDTREELLGSRFHLKKQRVELRRRHQKAGEDEGVVISLLRRVFLDASLQFPEEIITAYSKLETLRDELGTLENDYEVAEEKYNQQEWKYTQRESTFIEKIVTHGNSDDNFRFDENVAATADLTRYAHGSGEPSECSYDIVEAHEGMGDRSLPTHNMDYSNETEDTDEVGRLAEKSSGHPVTAPLTEPNLAYLTRTSSPRKMDDATTPPTRAYSESAFFHAQVAWSKTRWQVEKWILDTLKCSHLQRTRLKRLLEQDSLDDESWWKLVVHYWRSDYLDTPLPRLDIAQSMTTWMTASDQWHSNEASTAHKVASEKMTDLDPVTPALLLPDDTGRNFTNPSIIPETLDPKDLLDPRSTSENARGSQERSDTPMAGSSRQTSTFSHTCQVGSCQTDMTRPPSPISWIKPPDDAHAPPFHQNRITGLASLPSHPLDDEMQHLIATPTTDQPLEENRHGLTSNVRDQATDNPIKRFSQVNSKNQEEIPPMSPNTYLPLARSSEETLLGLNSTKDGSSPNSGDRSELTNCNSSQIPGSPLYTYGSSHGVYFIRNSCIRHMQL